MYNARTRTRTQIHARHTVP